MKWECFYQTTSAQQNEAGDPCNLALFEVEVEVGEDGYGQQLSLQEMNIAMEAMDHLV